LKIQIVCDTFLNFKHILNDKTAEKKPHISNLAD